MKHIMHLAQTPFEKIKRGSKTIELRLYDEKRKQIQIGDTILFFNLENPEDSIQTQVKDIYIFESFDELFRSLPLKDLGYEKDEIESASPHDLEKFYPKEKQARFQVVGFRLALLS